MTTDRPVPTLSHPNMEWKLSNDDETNIAVKVEYSFAMPAAMPPPESAAFAPDRRHPYPNSFRVSVAEADGTGHAATLSRPEAERLHATLGEALKWDGQ